MRRGLTMIELLLSLSLLGAIAVATTSWLGTAAEMTVAAPETRWRAAAEAAMQLVHNDLVVGDRETDSRRPKVEVSSGMLSVRTRDARGEFAGQVVHEYQLDLLRRELVLRERGPAGKERRRVLLDRVRRWTCELDKELEALDVTIEREDGFTMNRRFSHAPDGD